MVIVTKIWTTNDGTIVATIQGESREMLKLLAAAIDSEPIMGEIPAFETPVAEKKVKRKAHGEKRKVCSRGCGRALGPNNRSGVCSQCQWKKVKINKGKSQKDLMNALSAGAEDNE